MRRAGQSDMVNLIRFIPAGSKTDIRSTADKQATEKGILSGEEAKTFYEDLIQESSLPQAAIEDRHRRKAKRKAGKACETGACGSQVANGQNVPIVKLEYDCHDRNEFSVETRESQKYSVANVKVEHDCQDTNEFSVETRKRYSVPNVKLEFDCQDSDELSIETRRGSSHGQLPENRLVNHQNQSKQNENKLLSFAQNGDLKQLMKLLKDNPGVDIDHQDQYGWTALMCATVAGHKQIVQHLLSKGANKWMRNTSGKSAIQLAEDIGAKHIVKVLSYSERSIQQSSNREKSKQSFYCELCKSTFSDSSEKEHNTSTVHLFNRKLKPKPDPFMIPASNIGYRLMRSSGWDGEKGLGPEGKGSKFPVKTVLKTDRLCLGSEASQKKKAKITHFGPNDTEAVSVEHKHTLNRVLSARASSKKERRRREQKEKRWETNLRQYWDIDCDGISLDKM